MKKYVMKYGSAFAAFALFVGKLSTLAACRYCFHQPEVPEQMKNFQK